MDYILTTTAYVLISTKLGYLPDLLEILGTLQVELHLLRYFLKWVSVSCLVYLDNKLMRTISGFCVLLMRFSCNSSRLIVEEYLTADFVKTKDLLIAGYVSCCCLYKLFESLLLICDCWGCRLKRKLIWL